jgi:hypothetical protein
MNYHYTLPNSPDKRTSQLLRDGSLKSRISIPLSHLPILCRDHHLLSKSEGPNCLHDNGLFSDRKFTCATHRIYKDALHDEWFRSALTVDTVIDLATLGSFTRAVLFRALRQHCQRSRHSVPPTFPRPSPNLLMAISPTMDIRDSSSRVSWLRLSSICFCFKIRQLPQTS